METNINYIVVANSINRAYTPKYSTTRFTLLLENMVLAKPHLFDLYDDLLAEEIWAIQLDKFIDKVITEFRGNGLYTLLDLMELNNYSGWLRFYISDKMMPCGTPRQDKALVKVKMTLSQLEQITDTLIQKVNNGQPK